MFPASRLNLHRNSEQQQQQQQQPADDGSLSQRTNSVPARPEPRHKSIPVPAAVQLFNMMAEIATPEQAISSQFSSSVPSTTPPSSSKKWFRPAHSVQLLHRLCLEIIVVGHSHGPRSSDGSGRQTDSHDGECKLRVHGADEHTDADAGPESWSEEEKSVRVVYTCSTSYQPSINPSWEHINERIQLPERWWEGSIGERTYKSMRLRIRLIDRTDDIRTAARLSSKRVPSSVIVDMSLHPSSLQRLHHLPQSLPPNSCIVHFTDGSMRCVRSLHQLLVDERLVDAPPKDSVEDFLRFEDNAFRKLDAADSARDSDDGRGSSGNCGQIAKHDSVNIVAGRINETASNESDPVVNSAALPKLQVITQSDATLSSNADMPPAVAYADAVDEDTMLMAAIAEEEEAISRQLASIQTKKDSLQRLTQKIQRSVSECAIVEKEVMSRTSKLHRNKIKCNTIQRKLLSELQSIYPIRCGTKYGAYSTQARGRSTAGDDDKEAIRRSSNSPTTETSDVMDKTDQPRYSDGVSTIRGLRLFDIAYFTGSEAFPAVTGSRADDSIVGHGVATTGLVPSNPMSSPAQQQMVQQQQQQAAIPEEETSAALGFTCHVVLLICKYLSVAPRCRMIHNSSRSGIMSNESDGGGSLLPLFVGRSVDRGQFEMAMSLLHGNVDCIASTQGMGEFFERAPSRVENGLIIRRRIHILEKLDMIFRHVLE